MPYYTQAQAARLLGVTRAAVALAIKRGSLHAVEIAKNLRVIEPLEIDRYRQQVSSRYNKVDQFSK